jgi:hypothetical protein
MRLYKCAQWHELCSEIGKYGSSQFYLIVSLLSVFFEALYYCNIFWNCEEKQ